jgi:hypothetical protein
VSAGLASPVIQNVRSRRCLLTTPGLDVVASLRRDLLRPGSSVPIARLAVDCRGTQCVQPHLTDVPRVPRNDKEVVAGLRRDLPRPTAHTRHCERRTVDQSAEMGTIDDGAVCRPYGALIPGWALATELTPLTGLGYLIGFGCNRRVAPPWLGHGVDCPPWFGLTLMSSRACDAT